jgi:manganese efflux pump family protein
MSPAAVAVLALGLSIDSGIACIGRGAGRSRPDLCDLLVTGLVFGLVQAMTPLIGWTAGLVARPYVVAIDHWIAFGLLGGVGAYMVVNGVRGSDVQSPADAIRSPLILLATAVGTSIDAMAVGVSLSFLQVDILAVALAIGVTTCVAAICGSLFGRFVGRRFGRWAEIAGGVALSLLGLSILIDHLFAGG